LFGCAILVEASWRRPWFVAGACGIGPGAAITRQVVADVAAADTRNGFDEGLDRGACRAGSHSIGATSGKPNGAAANVVRASAASFG
jgi:hypothetical protein